MNTQAADLNNDIQSGNPHVLNLLSKRGKNIFFPKSGILAQSAEAKGKDINATIGTALEDTGLPMTLDVLTDQVTVKSQSFIYASSYGNPDMRTAWKEMMFRKNPGLQNAQISNPVVTSALTHGLSLSGYLFMDEGDSIIIPDLFWGNYKLIFQLGYDAALNTYPTFVNGHFNVKGLQERLTNSDSNKQIVLLNFPNNPTGYTISVKEAEEIRDVLKDAADSGKEIVVLVDDAYFGLIYEEGMLKESIFSYLANLHPNILAVKLDGPTKEDYVWGFRVGFITFGTAQNTPELYTALEAKTAGTIRGNISNAPNISQSLLLAAYKDTRYEQEKQEKYTTLKTRYTKIQHIFSAHPEYDTYFYPIPFNSGYFMCIQLRKGDPEQLRRHLLDKYSTGLITQGTIVRIAFSSTPTDKIETLFDNIYKAAQELFS